MDLLTVLVGIFALTWIGSYVLFSVWFEIRDSWRWSTSRRLLRNWLYERRHRR